MRRTGPITNKLMLAKRCDKKAAQAQLTSTLTVRGGSAGGQERGGGEEGGGGGVRGDRRGGGGRKEEEVECGGKGEGGEVGRRRRSSGMYDLSFHSPVPPPYVCMYVGR